MNYRLSDAGIVLNNQCLVVGICNEGSFSDAIRTLDEQNNGIISRLSKKLHDCGDVVWQGEFGEANSLLLLHCGNSKEFTKESLHKRMAELSALLVKHKITSVSFCLPPLSDGNADEQLVFMVQHLAAHYYQYHDFKTKNIKPLALEAVDFYLEGASKEALLAGQAIAQGIELTRKLADCPANHCTPSYLAEQALLLATQHKSIRTTIVDQEQMRAMGMGALLAVAQGSNEPPKLIDVHYQGAGTNSAPIILVGKGITFDSGGLSIKPAEGMVEMKYDMCGAASVLGVLKACALLKLPINVIGLIASAENLLSGNAVKPGDVVTSMSGQTIEILNTDAEGRLVLADALTYAERYAPELVIDIATLTGAIVIALGNITTGLMTNDDALANDLLRASIASGDKCWRMPLFDAYQEALDSPVADMINANFDRSGGAIVAGCFLSRFTSKYRWAHLDIAGTAWISGKKRQATGRPVPLLIEFLRHAASQR